MFLFILYIFIYIYNIYIIGLQTCTCYTSLRIDDYLHWTFSDCALFMYLFLYNRLGINLLSIFTLSTSNHVLYSTIDRIVKKHGVFFLLLLLFSLMYWKYHYAAKSHVAQIIRPLTMNNRKSIGRNRIIISLLKINDNKVYKYKQ